jgi:hypothetical protein
VYNLNYTPTTLRGGGGTKLKRNYISGYAKQKRLNTTGLDNPPVSACLRKV